MRPLLDLFRNPVFRHDLRRQGRWRWTLLLVSCSSLYVAAFVVAHTRWERSLPLAAASYAPQFEYRSWLLVGAVILSVCSHWLVPPFVLTLLRARYELPSLTVLVRERLPDQESLRAQLAARVAPLLAGLVPLVLLAGLLLCADLKYGFLVAGAMVAGLVWAGLCTALSLWSGVINHRLALAHAWSYGLLTVALPLAFGGVAAVVGAGCSAGRAHPEPTFWLAACLTWWILVVGAAATFWDLAFTRVFPERRYALWQESAPVERLEP